MKRNSKDAPTRQYAVGGVNVVDRYDPTKGIINDHREVTVTDRDGHQVRRHYVCDSDTDEQRALSGALKDLNDKHNSDKG